MKRTGLLTAALGFFLFAQIAQAGWTPAKRLTWNAGRSEYPAAAIDSADAIHVVWDDYPFSITEIYYKRSTDGGTTWGAARRLTWTSGQSEMPAIAVDSADAIHVVWQDSTPGNWEIYYKRSTDGGTTWGSIQRLAWTAGESLFPAIDSSGSVHVVWEDGTPGNYEVYFRSSADGGATWNPTKRLTWTPAGSFGPDIAIGASDQIHVVWSDDNPGNDEIFYKRSTDGGATWSAARRLTWTSNGSFKPAIAIHSTGQIHIAWYNETPDYGEIYYKRSADGGTTWNPIRRLTWSSGRSEYPAIAVDSGNLAHVIWQDEKDGGLPEVYYKKGN